MENKKLKFRLAFQVVDENDRPFRQNMSFQECLEIPLSFPADNMKHDHFCDIKDQMLQALESIVKAAQTNYLFVPNQELIPADKDTSAAHTTVEHELTIHSFGTEIVVQRGSYGDKCLIPHKILV